MTWQSRNGEGLVPAHSFAHLRGFRVESLGGVIDRRITPMLRLYTAANLPDAHMLRQLLAQAGIEAHVFNENAQSGMGEIPFTHAWPEVWLAQPGDEKQAREIVRIFERPPIPSADVFCAACHERNPGNFELCWSCGAAL